jgi:hypothetical protein
MNMGTICRPVCTGIQTADRTCHTSQSPRTLSDLVDVATRSQEERLTLSAVTGHQAVTATRSCYRRHSSVPLTPGCPSMAHAANDHWPPDSPPRRPITCITWTTFPVSNLSRRSTPETLACGSMTPLPRLTLHQWLRHQGTGCGADEASPCSDTGTRLPPFLVFPSAALSEPSPCSAHHDGLVPRHAGLAVRSPIVPSLSDSPCRKHRRLRKRSS